MSVIRQHDAFSLDSARRRFFFKDDFLGDQMQDLWRISLIGGATITVVDAQTGGIARITSPTTTNIGTIDFGNIRSVVSSNNFSAEFKVKVSAFAAVILEFGFILDPDTATRMIDFTFNAAAPPNIMIRCKDGVGQTSVSSGVALDTDYHIYRIDVHGGGDHVHFYIDDVETSNSPISTNIPTEHLQPYWHFWTTEDVSKTSDMDYVVISQERT